MLCVVKAAGLFEIKGALITFEMLLMHIRTSIFQRLEATLCRKLCRSYSYTRTIPSCRTRSYNFLRRHCMFQVLQQLLLSWPLPILLLLDWPLPPLPLLETLVSWVGPFRAAFALLFAFVTSCASRVLTLSFSFASSRAAFALSLSLSLGWQATLGSGWRQSELWHCQRWTFWEVNMILKL